MAKSDKEPYDGNTKKGVDPPWVGRVENPCEDCDYAGVGGHRARQACKKCRRNGGPPQKTQI